MPIIRIAPVYNGKVYVTQQPNSGQMDLPLVKRVDIAPTQFSNKQARELIQRYTSQIQTEEHPRFSVKYTLSAKHQEEVYLYILPLGDEKEVHFESGRFIDAEEIQQNVSLFSEYLQKESGLLSMAAELWQDYL